MQVVDARGRVGDGEGVERIVREIRSAIVLPCDIDGFDVRGGRCGTVERDAEDRDVCAFEALQDSAVGPVGVGDQNERDWQIRILGGEVALFDGGDPGALRISVDDDGLAGRFGP